MKRILFFGGFGFIGTNVLKYIDEHLKGKYSVTVFDRYLQHPHNIKFNCIEKVYAGDFIDSLSIEEVIANNRFDYVIHAVTSTVPTSSQNSRFDIETNLIPTINLLDLLVKHKIKNIVYFSSGGAIYGEGNEPHKEQDNPFPLSSYGIVKLAIERYLYLYQHQYNISPLILRVSNPYGPYHYSIKQGIINVALRAAITNNEFSIWGDGEMKKDYIFIEDVCDILFQLLEKNICNDTINIASGNILSLNQIVGSIQDFFPSFCPKYTHYHNFDIRNFRLNISKMLDYIGDFHFTSFEEGLLKTKNWQENNLSK